jgi:hypothetical protein
MTFLSLREARRRGLTLMPASQAPAVLVEQGRAEIGPPFPAGRYIGSEPGCFGRSFHVYDTRLWRWSKWGDVGTCGPDRVLHRRCLVPTWRAKRILKKIERGQTLFGPLDREVYQAMPILTVDGVGKWQDVYGPYAPPPSVAAQQQPAAAPDEEPMAPWFVWAMVLGIGGVLVYATLPPEPAPRRRTA